MFKLILLLSILGLGACDRSFTLVLDTTKSMEAEILEVRAYIRQVLSGDLNYGNFVLVPFKDTDVEPIFTTESVRDYITRLNALSTSGGEDCPENSLAGIEAALRASEKQSTIFVFTDGYAKDFQKFRIVESLCQETHSQVIIFLSGHCSSNGPVGAVEVYLDIAKACSGAMLKWDSLVDLREAFKYMKEVIHTDWTNITTFERITDFKPLSFSVDRFTTDLMIVASGVSPAVEIVGTNYQNVKIQSVVRTRQPLVFRITPEEGEYVANIRGQGPTSVTFYERRYVPFEFGFSTKSPRTIRETSARPIAGLTNYILIKVDFSMKLRSVEWLYLGESSKQVVLLNQVSQGLYVSSVFCESEKMFRFWIVGEDVNTQHEIRGASQILAPQVSINEDNLRWIKPTAEILDADLSLVDYGSTLTLAARVVGFPRPDVRWQDESSEILQSETILLEIPSVYISYMTITHVSKNSTVSCHVRNDEGEVARSIDVFVNRTFTFDVIQSPEDASVEFGSEFRLNCEIDAYPEATIQWYLNDSLVDSTNSRLFIEEKNALVIKIMGFEDIGEYECRASNGVESKTYLANIGITGVEAPEIDGRETEVHFKPSDLMAEIECRILKGKPAPELSWQYKSFNESDFKSLPYGASSLSTDKIKFEQIDSSNAGVYRCVASNAVGEDLKDFNVNIMSPPVIKNQELETLTVRNKHHVHLSCDVEATPQATVRWEMSQDDVIVTFDLRHWTDNKYTHHFEANPSDSGNYHCVAENIVGKAERTVVVNVLVTAYIGSQPERFSVNVGASVSLPCTVHGNPIPAIRWEFKPTDSPTFTKLNRDDPLSEFKIEVVKKSDEGLYRCIAENQIGGDSVQHELVVQ